MKNGFIFQVPAVLLPDPRVFENWNCKKKVHSAELQKASGVVVWGGGEKGYLKIIFDSSSKRG